MTKQSEIRPSRKIVVSCQVKYSVSMGPGDPAPRRIPKRQEDTRPPKTCRRMFAVLLFIIAPNWKQLKCPFDGAWIDHLRPTQTLGYYSARREALSCTRPGRFGWRIMRSERSQTQKAARRMIPFQWRSGKKNNTKLE